MSKETVFKIREAEAEAQRIIAQARADAEKMVKEAEAEGERLCRKRRRSWTL